MERHLRSALVSLGCTEKEIKLYLSAYVRGSASLSELIGPARLQRSTAYLVAKDLLDKGLFSEDHKAYGKTLTAAEPETLLRLLARSQRQIGRQHMALQDRLDGLRALYGTSQTRPQVKTYQGGNGLVSVWRDILTAKSEILIWTNQATESRLFNTAQHEQFIQERQRGGRTARVLAVNNPEGHRLKSGDADALRQTKLLPPSILFSAETYVYDDKVAVLDYDQAILGIITRSLPVAEAHRAMFETSWSTLKP